MRKLVVNGQAVEGEWTEQRVELEARIAAKRRVYRSDLSTRKVSDVPRDRAVEEAYAEMKADGLLDREPPALARDRRAFRRTFDIRDAPKGQLSEKQLAKLVADSDVTYVVAGTDEATPTRKEVPVGVADETTATPIAAERGDTASDAVETLPEWVEAVQRIVAGMAGVSMAVTA